MFRDVVTIRVSPKGLDTTADWWVVVDSGDLAVARLWRPGTGGDDLPPAPRIAKRECRVTVVAENGEGPVAGAVVVPTQSADLGATAAIAGISDWQAWLEPAVTSATGRAVLEVPDAEETVLRVGAHGFMTGAGVCRKTGEAAAGGSVVRLRPRGEPAEFLFRAAGQGSQLSGALVRDGLGWPVSLIDENGRAALDRTASLWHVETESGVTYLGRPSEDAEAATIDLTSTSALAQGVIRLEGADAFVAGSAWDVLVPEAESPPVDYWLELPDKPWSSLHRATASLRSVDRERGFGIHMSPSGRVWFSAPGRGYDACSVVDVSSAACPVLRPGLSIRGRVLDERGEALQNVEILLSRGPVRRGGPSLKQFLRTRRTGRFASERLPIPRRRFSDYVAISIRHPGFLPIEAASIGHYLTDDGEYVIQLQRGVVVTGTVVDGQSGEPVADAEVGFGPFSSMGASITLNRLSALRAGRSFLGRTDADGEFAIRAPPGREDFAVRSEGHSFRLIRGVEVEEVETQDMGVIPLEPAALVRGVVLDEAGVPIPGASVTAIAQRTPDVFGRVSVGDFGDALRLRTDNQGMFAVVGLAHGARVDLEAAASGFASQRLRGLIAGAANPVVISLQRGAAIEGRMTRDGEPLAGTFELFGSSHRNSQDPVSGDLGYVTSGQTRADGTFRIAHLAPDRYRLLLYSRTGASKRVVVELEAGEERWLDAELGGKTGRIIGRVTDRGNGLAAAAVVLSDVGETGTDARGRFVFDEVLAGSYVLEVDPGTEQPAARRAVQVRGGKQRVDFDFGRYLVSGRAVLEDGSSEAGGGRLTFLAVDGPQTHGPFSVGASGDFTAELRRGDYHVGGEFGGKRVRSDEPLRVLGDMADTVLRLRLLAPSGRIAGMVHGLTEEEINSLRVEAVDKDFAVREGSIDSRGGFLVERVPAGDWTLAGTVGISNRRAVTQVIVRDGETWADLVFTPGHRLEGTVHLDGTPWPGAQVLLVRDGETMSARRQFTAQDGGFVFQDLVPGQYTLAVGAEKRSVRVAGNERADVHLQSARARGVVLDAAALPQAGEVVLLWPAEASRAEARAAGLTRQSWTDEDGRFEFRGLPAGNWKLQVDGRPDTRRILRLVPASEVAVIVQ